jgi:hypothetical protein
MSVPASFQMAGWKFIQYTSQIVILSFFTGCIPCGSACTLGRREAGTLSLSRFLTNTIHTINPAVFCTLRTGAALDLVGGASSGYQA